jgi:ribosome maturation factor RimP
MRVRVFIDHLAGTAPVTLGDCGAASKALQQGLDLDRWLPGRYNLEVSSPGVDRPLTRPEHFQRFRGEEAVVRWRAPDRALERVKGRITAADAHGVTLELEGGVVLEVPYGEIESARLELDPWKRRSSGQVETDHS